MAIHFYPNMIFASKALGQCYKHFLDRSQCYGVLQCAGFHAACRLSCNMQTSLQHAGFFTASMQVYLCCRLPSSVHVSMQLTGFLAPCRLPYSMQASLQQAFRDIYVAGFHSVCGFPCSVQAFLHCAGFLAQSGFLAASMKGYLCCRLPCSVKASLQCECFLAASM
jgi:hypothetical protein